MSHSIVAPGMSSIFDQCYHIQQEVEDELISQAQNLANSPSASSKDYRALAEQGIKKLQGKIWRAIPASLKEGSTENFVASAIIREARDRFYSPTSIGGKLDRILKKLPEQPPQSQITGPNFLTTNFSVSIDFSQLKKV